MVFNRGERMKKVLAVFIMWILILAGVMSAAGCSMRLRKIRFGTAGIGGNYYSFGKTFSEFLMGDIPSVDVKVLSTAGSAENLKMITGKKPELELAIIQADILNEMEVEKDASFGAVAGMYAEALQIVVRQDSGIQSVEDLKGKTVSLGESSSGTERNAQVVLEAYGLNDGDYEACHLKYTDASGALEDGSIDAFFCTMGIPTSTIRTLAGKIPIRLLDVDADLAEDIMREHPFYVSYTIPAGTYTGQKSEVRTIGVKSVLVAHNSLSTDMVNKITNSLFAHAKELKYAVWVDYEPDPQEAVTDLPIPLHEGARSWYESNGIALPD